MRPPPLAGASRRDDVGDPIGPSRTAWSELGRPRLRGGYDEVSARGRGCKNFCAALGCGATSGVADSGSSDDAGWSPLVGVGRRDSSTRLDTSTSKRTHTVSWLP